MQGRLEGAIAEIGDLLYYCNDIINSGVPALKSIMTKNIMNVLVLPLLLPSLRPVDKHATIPSVRFSLHIDATFIFLNLITAVLFFPDIHTLCVCVCC